jgi:hypothetical protein
MLSASQAGAAIIVDTATSGLVTQAEDGTIVGGATLGGPAGNSVDQFIGNFRNGDYVEFELDVQSPGPYDIDIRYAHASSGRSIALQAGNDVDGFTTIKNWALGSTGNWTDFTYTGEAAEVTLPAGPTTLRFQSTSTGANFDEWTISYVPEPTGLSLLALGAVAVLRRRKG